MSKEQTPITAEARLKELGLIKKGYSHFIIERGNECFELVEIMEQYAQAKVLEALEKEVIKACMKYNATAIFNKKLAKEYYETEVKPKYKQINK